MEDQTWIDERRKKRMNDIDALPAELRKCVHDYGFNVVTACTQCGIKNPKHIRHIVETVLDEFSPTRGARSTQGTSRAPGFSGPPVE